jgi:hypothetical protein
MNITRRNFLHNLTAASLLPSFVTARDVLPRYEIRTLTAGPKHHFFGYYGIPPWNKSEKYLVCLESDHQDHLPKPEEAGRIGIVEAKTGKFTQVGTTHAWNFQQGTMLHWNPLQPESEILFNEREGDKIISAALNVENGKKRLFPTSISAVSRNGRYALSLTYGRLARMRPVVGYVGARDPNPNEAHPQNDGIFLLDLKTGQSKLVVSIREVFERLVRQHPELKDRHMWFNHTVFNKNDTRFFFLARIWKEERGGKRLESAMFTANLDGSDLREVIPFGNGVSHFEWRNDKEIMATFRFNGPEVKHVLFTDGKQDYQSIGEGFLKNDGHCSFAPDQQWLVTDRNLDETFEKMLMIYHLEAKQGLVLGKFAMRNSTYLRGDLRCDLHPRWSRSGKMICFDAIEPQNFTRP